MLPGYPAVPRPLCHSSNSLAHAPWQSAGAEPLDSLGASWVSPLQLQVYMAACSSGEGYAAPSLRFEPGRARVDCAALRLDVLCYAPRGMAAAEAVDQVGWEGWLGGLGEGARVGACVGGWARVAALPWG